MFAPTLTRLKALVFRRAVDAELDEELRYHLEREAERNIVGGMSPDAARDAARRAIGNVTVTSEEARDAWRWRLLEELGQDIAYAVRSFRRAPAFVATVVATIGVGLGLLVTVFTLFDAYVLRPLSVRDPAALYEISWHSRDRNWHVFTREQYDQLRSASVGFAQVFAYQNLITRINTRPMVGQLVTANYFDLVGVPPAIGRTLVPNDDAAPGSGSVMVLSHDTWQSQFAGDTNVVGRRVLVNGVSLTIVGVAAEGYGGLGSWPYQFWVPMSMAEPLNGWKRINTILKGSESLRIVGRLAPGVSPEQANTRLRAWLRATTADRAPLARANDVMMEARGTAMPLSPELIQVFAPIVVAFVLVMLIACANVANMMLARALARQREIGIRLALGAGRRRLVRQLLTESVVLSIPAGLVGLVVSRVTIAVGSRAIFATIPPDYAPYLRAVDLAPDMRVVAFVLGGAIAAAVAFGLVPALRATRPDVVRASRGDFDTPFRPSRLRNGLVVAQITMSVLLLICAGVLLRTARRIDRLEPGIRTNDVVQLEVLDRSRSRVLATLATQPDVHAIASAMHYPLDGIFPGLRIKTDGDSAVRVAYNVVSPDYFVAIGLSLVRGRAFTENEARGAAPVVLVSEGAAARLWKGADPIGQTLTVGEDLTGHGRIQSYRTATVLGVVSDAAPGWIGLNPHDPVVYYPEPIDASGSAILVRVAGDVTKMKDRLDRLLMAADSGSVQEIHTLAVSLALQSYPFRSAYWLASGVGILALLLTLTGVYGVIGYVVAQRRREFGIRMALGASPLALVALVLRHAMRLAIVGFVIGAMFALAASLGFASLLYGVDVYDPVGYALGAAVVLGTCFVASYIPSRRAATVDPVEALRTDG
jgi:predicted permease